MTQNSQNLLLILILSRIVLRGDNEPLASSSAAVNGLHNVNKLLLIGQRPVDLIVVTGAQIDHHVLVSVEKHHRAGVVQLVHGYEVRNLLDVHQVDHRQVGDRVVDLEECLVHEDAFLCVCDAESDDLAKIREIDEIGGFEGFWNFLGYFEVFCAYHESVFF